MQMDEKQRRTIKRKSAMLQQYIDDLGRYAELDRIGRRAEHYAIERLLQLLCEASADIGLQLLKSSRALANESYREIFTSLRDHHRLPDELSAQLLDGCSMRNLLTHLYESIDLDRVAAAIEPALATYPAFKRWVGDELEHRPEQK